MAKNTSPPAAARPWGPARIEHLRVENYRVLRRIELSDIMPLTVLLGPNGSGKSTIKDAPFAWSFSDWEAVLASYRVPATIPTQAKYRVPDAVAGGTWEAFERVLQRAGYFRMGLAKIEASKTIAANMEPTRNSSRSFQALRDALAEMARA